MPFALARRAAAAAAAVALASSAATAGPVTTVDLYAPNQTTATINGALYQQVTTQPTGTGVFDPFVRIQMTGTERGYNTDARPVEFDTKDQNQWTHSLLLKDLVATKIGGQDYYTFTLDANEQGNAAGKLLSLNDLEVYLGTRGDLTGYGRAGSTFTTQTVKVYDLDSAAADYTVNLNTKTGSAGSGDADLAVNIPVGAFQGKGAGYQYVYLYSAFGSPHRSDAGFEEWSARVNAAPGSTPPGGSPVPAPPAAVLGGVALAAVGLVRRRAAAV